MAEPAKYLFDRSFGPPSRAKQESPAERRLKADFERQLAETRKAVFEEGRAEGERVAHATIEAQTARTLDAVLAQTSKMCSAMSAEYDAIQAHAVDVAVTVAERLSREFLRREPLSEIETLVSDCLDHISQTPHIVVHVNAALAEPVKARLREIASTRGYAGQITVVGSDAIDVGDCRLEWAEGGISRNFQATLDSIKDAIARHLSARQHEVGLRGPEATAESSGDSS